MRLAPLGSLALLLRTFPLSAFCAATRGRGGRLLPGLRLRLRLLLRTLAHSRSVRTAPDCRGRRELLRLRARAHPGGGLILLRLGTLPEDRRRL